MVWYAVESGDVVVPADGRVLAAAGPVDERVSCRGVVHTLVRGIGGGARVYSAAVDHLPDASRIVGLPCVADRLLFYPLLASAPSPEALRAALAVAPVDPGARDAADEGSDIGGDEGHGGDEGFVCGDDDVASLVGSDRLDGVSSVDSSSSASDDEESVSSDGTGSGDDGAAADDDA